MILKHWLSLLFLAAGAQIGLGQMTVPTTLCSNQEFSVLSNSPVDILEVSWDFCEGDLLLTPTQQQRTVSDFNIPVGTSLIKTNGKWYGFVCSLSNNSIFRIDFGSSLSNPSPSVVNLGNIGGLVSSPQDIQVLEYQDNYYGFVFNRSTNKLIRINFGTDIETNAAGATVVLSGSGFINGGLEIIFDGSQWIGVLTNSNMLTLANLGSSPLNVPTVGDILTTSTIAGIASIADIKFVKEGGIWYGFAIGFGSGTLHRLTFGSSLYADPSSVNLYTLPSTPFGLSLNNDNGNWITHITTIEGNLLRVNFGLSVLNAGFTVTNLGNLGGLANTLKMDMALDGTRWYILSAVWNTKNYVLLEFPEPACNFTKSTSTQSIEYLQTTNTGSHQISLFEKNSEGSVLVQRQIVDVLTLPAPVIDISTTSICEDVAGTYSVESNQTVVSASWIFEGNGSSGSMNPVVQYNTPGIYTIQVDVLTSTGCGNMKLKELEVYAAPNAPTFTSPSGLICTNNEFTFLNTTPDTFDDNLSYQWLVDDVPASTQRDLLHTFVTGGDKEITLQTSIPGCSSESIQTLTDVGEGPVVDFTIEGACLSEDVQLINGSSGDIASYAWDFGDGQTSTEPSPVVSYEIIGTYAIELETTGNNGCVSTKVVNHQIFSIPQPNFNIDLPPFSCNGTPTQFNDLTPLLVDSNLESWLWNFNDNGATADAQSPTHIYALSGSYDVTLTATSDQGCSAQLIKNIIISESPNPIIVNTAACVDTGVEFTTSSAQPIVEWQWRMGNSYYYTENPSHVFDEPGEFSVSLVVTGQNGCINSSSKDIFVPEPIEVDFTSSKKCVDAGAQFVAVTDADDDLPSTYEWTLDGVVKQGQTITHTFARADLYEVLLRVTAESGCVYSLNKAQTVLEKPVADFSFSPKGGSPPLSVRFTNASVNANAFLWHFNDATNATSTSESPNFTFTEIGNYPVDLRATNEEGCESTVSKLINIALPLLFVSLDEFEVIQNQNGLLQMRVTVNNEGNVDLQSLPLAVSLNNATQLHETVPQILSGGESKTVVLTTSISKTPGLQFLCLTLELDNNSIGATEELCISLEGGTIFTAPHPNPAKDIVTLEWIAAQEENITLSVVNSVGKEMQSISFLSQQGLNNHVLSTSLWQEGLYFVKIQSPGVEHTFRIIIVR